MPEREDLRLIREGIEQTRYGFAWKAFEALARLSMYLDKLEAVAEAAEKLLTPKMYYFKPGETPLVMKPDALVTLRAVLSALDDKATLTCIESENCGSDWHYWRCPKHDDYASASGASRSVPATGEEAQQ
jgi:hypothetical protein